MNPEAHRITCLSELNMLVGTYVTGERPETFWEDSHGYFQFHTEMEARRALSDPYYQRFLPNVDWSCTVIREVRIYRPYASDAVANWQMVEHAVRSHGPVVIWKQGGRWHAAFGTYPPGDGRVPMIAICLAALRACGMELQVDHDRIDAEVSNATDTHHRRTPPSAEEASEW